MAGAGAFALSYVAGALSILSPCVLPILPIVLLGVVERNRWGPLLLAGGLASSFTATGVLVAAFGFAAGIDAGLLRLTVAAVMVVVGVVLLIPSLQERLTSIAAPLTRGGENLIQRLQPSGVFGSFALGALLGVIWSPCAGPTLGVAVGLAAQSETALRATGLMATFSLGAISPILMLAYGSRQAITNRRDLLNGISRVGKPVTAVTLIVLGSFVLSGVDKHVEAVLTAAMPTWLVGLTTSL